MKKLISFLLLWIACTVAAWASDVHTITILDTEHGMVVADRLTAAAGETVTLTITPERGYELDSLWINERNVTGEFDNDEPWGPAQAPRRQGVDTTPSENGLTYTFVMPDIGVKVFATFKPGPHRIYIMPSERGSIVADCDSARKDDVVALLTQPRAGYYAQRVIVKKVNATPGSLDDDEPWGPAHLPAANAEEDDEVEVKCLAPNLYHFVMPFSAVVVSAAYAPALRGDVNLDGIVDVTDINIVVNIILGKDSAEIYDGRADLDQNGKVDVSDINIIVNIVLGKG